jgi:hypothetical protein
MDYHAREAFCSEGAGLASVGHAESERGGLIAWAEHLRAALPEVEVEIETAAESMVNLQ